MDVAEAGGVGVTSAGAEEVAAACAAFFSRSSFSSSCRAARSSAFKAAVSVRSASSTACASQYA